MRRAILSVLAILPAGCVSLSGGPCSPDAWRTAGFEDGAEGVSQEEHSERRTECEKRAHGAPSGAAAYLAGWRQGRDTYCTPERGFSIGAGGDAYHDICESPAAENFVAAYGKGRRLFELQASLIRVDRSLSKEQTRLWQTRRRISEVETAIMATTTAHEERVELTAELKSLQQESREGENRLADLAEEKARAARDLADYRSALVAESGALRPSNASY